ncbi:MAG: DNA polymerase III subunit alpha [Treponema sp.]|jgi:DNA polymerase-3 subunit alpha|nr:DNA polymerase III subunit alpha [Treponema sp.]
MAGFAHLHVHSDYSLLDGAASIHELAGAARRAGMGHLALTDHGNMFGAIKFMEACLGSKEHPLKKDEAPVHPLIGCEFYMAPASRFEHRGPEKNEKYYHLILLAASKTGYQNMMCLSSYSYMEGFYYKPRIDRELLKKYHEGIIALSACIAGEVPAHIIDGDMKAAEEAALWFRDCLGEDNYYLELQNHGIKAQETANKGLIEIAARTGIPLVITNDVHYLSREDAVAHDTLICIGRQEKRSDPGHKPYEGDQFYFKSGEEMAALFRGSEYSEALANTLRIASRIKTEVWHPGPMLPEFQIPAGFALSPSPSKNRVSEILAARRPAQSESVYDGENPVIEKPETAASVAGESPSGPQGSAYTPEELAAGEYLWYQTMKGLERRYPDAKEQNAAEWRQLQERAAYELSVVIGMDFTGYFLIVSDFIAWARGQNIPIGPGRGSGAGSLVAYSLRITGLDPIRFGLVFERFLNPERISMPDFDIDFCNERREEVIHYVTERYGKEHVAQIITFGTLKARAVIKDVARALDISLDEANMIAKLIPEDPKITLTTAMAENDRLAELAQKGEYTELFAIAKKLEGKNRHASIHASGVVIGRTNLMDYVPLYRDSKTGSVAVQYTMDIIENRGLVKMDFLGLKTLDLISHTEDLIRIRGAAYSDFSGASIPEGDKAVFDMLGEGKSAGIFQFESEGMQKVLRDAKPTCVEDLIALNALYRPGPMQNISLFIDSKHGKIPISYPDPCLEEILKETYGVIVYQEQVMKVAQTIAGFTPGHADELRRAMGKKKMAVMASERKLFIAGAQKQGHSATDAERIFELLIPFAGYGFNKSHSAAYAVIAYQTAYLKAHFPAEFMASNLSNEINSVDKLPWYIDETRKMGIAIDPPDINRSGKLFTVVEGRIVYGFLGIKGVGDGPSTEIIEQRKSGPYKGFMDFLDRVTLQTNQTNTHIVSRKVIELLIKTGAFDQFGINRPTLLANMEMAAEYSQNKKDESKFGQVSLFGNTDEKVFPDFKFTPLPDMERLEQLKIEKELIGFYFSGHPLDEYKELWRQNVAVNLGDSDHLPQGEAFLVGTIKAVRPITDKNGKHMAFGVLEDYNGAIDLVFFSRTWEKVQSEINIESEAALKGKIDKKNDKASFTVSAVLDIKKLQKAAKEKSAAYGTGAAQTNGMEPDNGKNPGKDKQVFKEVHVRLEETAARTEARLAPLLHYLIDNQGSSAVFIHVPSSTGNEVVIRGSVQLSTAGDTEHLRKIKENPAVAEAWGA